MSGKIDYSKLACNPPNVQEMLEEMERVSNRVHGLVSWQHDETGRICEVPKGFNPGERWCKIKTANASGEPEKMRKQL